MRTYNVSSVASADAVRRSERSEDEGFIPSNPAGRHINFLRQKYFSPVGFTIPPKFQTAFDDTNLFSIRFIALRIKTIHRIVFICAVCRARHIKTDRFQCGLFLCVVFSVMNGNIIPAPLSVILGQATARPEDDKKRAPETGTLFYP